MSLVPTWVLATDGQFYKDPVLRGNSPTNQAKWFLCFDDFVPPELVIAVKNNEKVTRDHAIAILDTLGFGYKVISKRGRTSYRNFGGLHMELATAFFLHIDSPIPVPQTHEGVETYQTATTHDCVIYTFGRK